MIQISKLFFFTYVFVAFVHCYTNRHYQTVKLKVECDKKNNVIFRIDTSYTRDSFCISWDTDYSACFSNSKDTIHISFICHRNKRPDISGISLETAQSKLSLLRKTCPCDDQGGYVLKKENINFSGYLLDCQSDKSVCLEYRGYSKEFDMSVDILTNSVPERRTILLENINEIISSLRLELLE